LGRRLTAPAASFPTSCARSYKVGLGVVWGVFGACLLAVLAFALWEGLRAAHWERRRRFGFVTEATSARASQPPSHEADSDVDDDGGPYGAPRPDPDAASSRSGGEPSPSSKARSSARAGSVWARASRTLRRAWSRRWVRRAVLLLRLGLVAADVAMDVAVLAWLWPHGDNPTAAGVCLAFIVLAQVRSVTGGERAVHGRARAARDGRPCGCVLTRLKLRRGARPPSALPQQTHAWSSVAAVVASSSRAQVAIGVATLRSLAPHYFASSLWAAALCPLLLPLTPLLGPLLALANTRQPDIPLVFWRCV
jgi:hypothetical protein